MALTTIAMPGPTATPIPLVAFGQAVVDNINELIVDLTPILAPWTVYTPTWSTNGTQPAIVDGTLSGRYTTLGPAVGGKVGFFEITMIAGAGTTFGTNGAPVGYSWGLPPGWTTATNAFGEVVVGEARISDVAPGTGLAYIGVVTAASASTVVTVSTHSATSIASPVAPIAAPGTGDQWILRGTVELA